MMSPMTLDLSFKVSKTRRETCYSYPEYVRPRSRGIHVDLSCPTVGRSLRCCRYSSDVKVTLSDMINVPNFLVKSSQCSLYRLANLCARVVRGRDCRWAQKAKRGGRKKLRGRRLLDSTLGKSSAVKVRAGDLIVVKIQNCNPSKNVEHEYNADT